MKTEIYKALYQTYKEYMLNVYTVEEFAEMKGISLDMMKAIILEFS